MKPQKKVEFNDDLSVLENLSQHREDLNKKNHRRYVIQRGLYYLRVMALIGLGVWGYLTRDIIREFILDVFTVPKLIYAAQHPK
jgi:hypothetical protein